jgi:prevent-host-death family protein
MKTITAFEAKTKFGELLERVQNGEEIVITRHEKPVARLVPEGSPSLEQTKRAAEGLEDLQRDISEYSHGQPPLSWEQFKTLVEEGRG